MDIHMIALYVSAFVIIGAHFGWRRYRKGKELRLIHRMVKSTGWYGRESELDDRRFYGDLLRDAMLKKFRSIIERAKLVDGRIVDRKYLDLDCLELGVVLYSAYSIGFGNERRERRRLLSQVYAKARRIKSLSSAQNDKELRKLIRQLSEDVWSWILVVKWCRERYTYQEAIEEVEEAS